MKIVTKDIFFQVGFQNAEKLHELHSDFPILPENKN